MRALKFLTDDGVARFSNFRWPRPEAGEPAIWVDADGELEACRHGVHACTREQMLDWLDDELWEIELAGRIIDEGDLVVADRGRLLRRAHGWDAVSAQQFADACAWRARTYALASLRRVGLTVEAQRLVDAADLDEMQASAAAGARGSDGPAAELSAFAADAVSLARGQRPETWHETAPAIHEPVPTPAAVAANVAFTVAHLAGREALAAEGTEGAYDAAYAAERRWQLAWLDERLRLGAGA